MADSATTKKLRRPGASFARRYGLAVASVAGALLLDLLFRYFNLPHPFAAFALSAIAATFWYAGTKPGIVAVLLSSLIRGFIFEGETSRLSYVLYDLVFLAFAILMIWVRRRKEALEVAIADRTTKLTAAKEDLRRRKEQLDGLFELSPDAVILTDDNFHVLRVNKEFTRIFGYTAEEVVGQWLPELIMPEELRAEALKNRERLISGNRVELEAIRQRKDGVRFDVSVVARGISLGFDQVGIYLIYRDITERKKAERELRRSEGYLAEAQKLTHTGSWAWNVHTGVLFWSRELFSIYDYEYQEIGSTWPQFLERVHPEDRPAVEEIFRRAQLDKTDCDASYRIVLPDGSIKHIYSVAHPILNQAGELVEFVGTSMDVTEQWKARTELEKAFEEIKQQTEAARRSERELRDVVNTVPAHVWRTSPEGQVDFVNDRWLQFTGLALDEAFGWKWESVVHPDDRTRVVADWSTALENGQAMESEARVRREDGEYCWWFIRNVPLRDETGKLVRWYGTAIDIEDRKGAEQALRKSEERWRSVFENSAIGVALTDLNGRFLATNHVYQTIVNYTEEELRALCFLDITHEDYREANWALITELLEGKRRQFQVEKKYLRKDGSSIWVSNNVSLVPGTERVPRFIMALSEDITQRKRAEEALQRSEGYLAEAQKLTHTGSWTVRVPQMENAQREAGQVLAVLPRFGWDASYWSKEMYRIFGLDPDSTPPSHIEVVRRLHPEDARHYTPVVEQAIRDRTDFETDYRLLLPNGAAKYIHVVGHPVMNASGDVIELVGTAMDVTEQHEARAALQTAFEQIRAEETELRRMTDAIATFVYVLRPDGTAFYANQTVLDYIGLTLEDVQREDHLARVFHPEDVERLREERHEALARGKPFELEQRALGKDGKYRWFLLRYNPLHDDQGHIIRWYATGTDIEDLKKTEERLRDENIALQEEIDKASMFEEIVGNSSALQTVLSRVAKVAPTDSTVLVTGETGTGKELVARAIHRRSQRSSRVFVSVNCAAIPRDLIASELFGHEKGAFTGATQQRLGRFELANGGTIFLDEVGELPAETQIALLRVLQEHEFERVGGTRSIQTDARVIAATNRDLGAAIAEGTFRSDLFYRLNVFPVEIPPLRERREDIHLLVEYFIDRYARKTGKKIRGIERSTLEMLRSYSWPGNIRELQNVIERSLIVCETQTFSVDESWLYRQPLPGKPKRTFGLSENLVAQEKEMIEAALRDSGGRVSGPAGAAARLGMPGSTLESKIRSLKINKNRFKPDDPLTNRI
jgi:PAS domain S-box-containing protein